MKHFINNGYGWVCTHCSPLAASHPNEDEARGRFFREGEAEDKEPTLSTPALARWKDNTRRALVCPRCNLEETTDN
jgi:hypothetical protein